MTAFDLDLVCISQGLNYLEKAMALSCSSGFTPLSQTQDSIQAFKPYKRSSLDKFRFISPNSLHHSSSLVKIRALTWPQVLEPCFTYLNGQKILLTHPIASIA